MRVLLSTIGSRGEVQPVLALASELRALGQDVHLCVPPDFRDWLAGLGFTVTPIGPELRGTAKARPAGLTCENWPKKPSPPSSRRSRRRPRAAT